ncbi:MAG: 4-hydroxy-tetrahydrodipicolinate synthase [Candidatus Magnetoovum sp. WYHC-5]|nr:4-hydroxy-tetrahydrodipicolinate synthase [Candidatus Magnetoovum sp. WYHC-5]
MFSGSYVAIVTPFKNGKFDESAYRALIEWHIVEGTNGIVPVGTTGESATLEYEEHYRVIQVAVETAAKRVPVIAGTGANSTSETIMMTKVAKELGADGALLVCPYYNKPTQEGLYQHFKAVAESVDLPLVLYNVPGRTAINIEPQTVLRLSEVPNIVAIKEASGDMKQASELIRLCGDKMDVLSGDDFTTFSLMAMGGKGVISVCANILPRLTSLLCKYMLANQVLQAREVHFKLEPLNKVLFIETNPIPVKTALSLMGKIDEEFRLPLCMMSKNNKDTLRSVLASYGIV